jgi:predicted RNase H-like nuclease (RuvC/YqgF family)
MQDIESLLSKYEPGLPKMKPDVLKQIKQIEEERKKMMEEEMKKQQANGPIVIQRPGEPPVQLSQQDVVNIIQQQQVRINELQKQLENSVNGGNKENPYMTRVLELENMISLLQKQLLEKMGEIRSLSDKLKSTPSKDVENTISVSASNPFSKSDPENIIMDIDFD